MNTDNLGLMCTELLYMTKYIHFQQIWLKKKKKKKDPEYRVFFTHLTFANLCSIQELGLNFTNIVLKNGVGPHFNAARL